MHVLLLTLAQVGFQNLEKWKEDACWTASTRLGRRYVDRRAHLGSPMIHGEAIVVLMALQKVPFYYRARPVISPS